MIDFIAQIGINIFGGAAIWLVGRPSPRVQRWGFVVGLIGQPCWFATMIINGQWGILPLVMFYTYSWADGIYQRRRRKEATA